MTNHWSGVTIDCLDPIRMSTFWGLLLGIEPSNEHGDDPGWATLGSRSDPTPRLTFQRVPESKSTKVRIHLDVQVDDIEAGRQQVESLGGHCSGIRHDYDEGVVLVMLDPESHEFCLVQYFEKPTVTVESESVKHETERFHTGQHTRLPAQTLQVRGRFSLAPL